MIPVAIRATQLPWIAEHLGVQTAIWLATIIWPEAKPADLAAACGINPEAARKALCRLRAAGTISKKDESNTHDVVIKPSDLPLIGSLSTQVAVMLAEKMDHGASTSEIAAATECHPGSVKNARAMLRKKEILNGAFRGFR